MPCGKPVYDFASVIFTMEKVTFILRIKATR